MLILMMNGYTMKQNNNKMDKQREALRQLRLAEIHILNAFDVVDYIHDHFINDLNGGSQWICFEV